MELQAVEVNEIEVQFIRNQEVVCIIKDEIPYKNCTKISIETPKHNKSTKHSSKVSTKNNKTKKTLNNDVNDEEYSEDESESILKPRVLFEDGDVPGERMFGFHSIQRKSTTNKISVLKTVSCNKIIKKDKINQFNHQDDRNFNSQESQSSTDMFGYETPKKLKKNENKSNLILKTPTSEKYTDTKQISIKTPKIIRKNIANGIAHQKLEQLNELNDSDYSISDKSDESDESDSGSSTQSDVKIEQANVKNINTPLRRSTRKKDIPFMYKSEEYFLSKSAKSMKKSKTSDNTLKLLKNPVLDKIQVDKLSEISNAVHDKKLKMLYKEIVSNFPYWLCLLKEGFNLILYGFGSKRQIINDFRTSMLEQESVLVINGFFPGLTLKEILESITIDLLALESCPGSTELVVQQIEENQKLKNAESIYILIHNLDGVELRSYKIQHILSRICSLKNVHLVASIDRVNAALMWDNTKLGDYNFIWMDCTNYLPYIVETSYIESVMIKNSGSIHAYSALNNVFKSLNSNSKSILLLLIKDRIENKNDKKYGGVPFSILYGWCRQRFLVSTDLALRSQLTEFVDHQLVKWKRDSDVLYVPVDVDVLIQFYKQNEEDDE